MNQLLEPMSKLRTRFVVKKMTTVSHKREMQRKYAEGFIYRVYEIKYELVGQQSRDTYRDLTLVPAIEKEVTGVKVIKNYLLKLVDKKKHADWFLDANEGVKHDLANHIRVPKISVNVDVTIDFE